MWRERLQYTTQMLYNQNARCFEMQLTIKRNWFCVTLLWILGDHTIHRCVLCVCVRNIFDNTVFDYLIAHFSSSFCFVFFLKKKKKKSNVDDIEFSSHMCFCSSSANTKFKHSFTGLNCTKTIFLSIDIEKKKHSAQMKSGLLDHDDRDQLIEFSFIVFSCNVKKSTDVFSELAFHIRQLVVFGK